MVRYCAVPSCSNNTDNKEIRFHRLPAKSRNVHEWLAICRVASAHEKKDLRICCQHFYNTDYIDGDRNKRLVITAVPKVIDTQAQERQENDTAELTILQRRVLTLEQQLNLAKVQIRMLRQTIRRLEETKIKKSSSLFSRSKFSHNQIIQLGKQNRKLASKNKKLGKFKKNCRLMFTETQMHAIESELSKANWTPKDIAKSLALKCISSKAYEFVRTEWSIPLPCLSTLRNTLRQFQVSTGPIFKVFDMIKEYFSNKSPMEKQFIIAYDEMAISSEICYFEREDRILGPWDRLQLVCIRGIFSSFKIPIFLDFNSAMSKEVLDDLIDRLHLAGVFPRAIVFDLGGSNRGLLNKLGITLEHPFYLHVKSNSIIRPLPDMAHLMKLLRNNFLDFGFTIHYDEHKKISFNKQVLQDLIRKDCNELKSFFKLTEDHLTVTGQYRQNVRKACEVFSSTVAEGIRKFSSSVDRNDIADFFDLVDKFWHLATARLPYHPTNVLKSAFGHPELIAEQTKIMNDFGDIIEKLRMGKKGYALKPFQKGYLYFKASHLSLWADFQKENFNPEYIITSNYGQCFLENTFAQIRGVHGFNRNPSPKECIYRIQGIMLSNLFRVIKSTSSIDDIFEDTDEVAEHLISFLKTSTTTCVQQDDAQTYVGPTIDLGEEINSDNWSEFYNQLSPEQQCEYGGQEYIAGYIAKKFLDKFPQMELPVEEQERNPQTFANAVSRGGLTMPSYEWINQFIVFDKEFVKYHSVSQSASEFRYDFGVNKTLSDYLCVKYPYMPPEIVKYFVKCRTYIRIKHLNMLRKSKVPPTDHSLRSAS